MNGVVASIGALLVRSAAAPRDTIYLATGASRLNDVVAIAQVIIALAVLVLVGIMLAIAWRLRRVERTATQLVDRVQRGIGPLIERTQSIAEDVNHVTSLIREQVIDVNTTISDANDRVHDAVALAEQRVNEFNALLAVVQDEAEQLFVSAASTVHGVRGGTAAFRDATRFDHDSRHAGAHGGMDLASDELDGADSASGIETQREREDDDGNDDSSESATPTYEGTPRVRPRPRAPRRA